MTCLCILFHKITVNLLHVPLLKLANVAIINEMTRLRFPEIAMQNKFLFTNFETKLPRNLERFTLDFV